VSTPELVCFREIVRGVHVEEQQIRIREAPDLIQGEDTDTDAVVEADGSKVSSGEAIRNRVTASWTIGGAQGLDTPSAAALGQHGVMTIQPVRERLNQ